MNAAEHQKLVLAYLRALAGLPISVVAPPA